MDGEIGEDRCGQAEELSPAHADRRAAIAGRHGHIALTLEAPIRDGLEAVDTPEGNKRA